MSLPLRKQTQHEQIEKLLFQLKEKGFRITPQRVAIMKTLIGSGEHLSAEEIYTHLQNDFPMIGLATIYKTLALLMEIGEITEINIDHQRVRFDGSGEPSHPHFVCSQCKEIVDLDYEDDCLENLTRKTEKKGYKVIKTRLELYGICPNCNAGT